MYITETSRVIFFALFLARRNRKLLRCAKFTVRQSDPSANASLLMKPSILGVQVARRTAVDRWSVFHGHNGPWSTTMGSP